MDRSVIDTDICSEIIRAKNAQVMERMAEYLTQYGQLTISAPTVVEITKGLVRVQQSAKLTALAVFFDRVDILNLDRQCAQLAGEIYGRLELAGKTIGRMDPMIAAIAILHDQTLVTGNVEHYVRIVSLGYGLRLANWRE
jgi:tRNA(fMet)-specific endonuclease VapC